MSMNEILLLIVVLLIYYKTTTRKKLPHKLKYSQSRTPTWLAIDLKTNEWIGGKRK